MAIVLRQCRQLPNLFWKNPQVFFGGIQRVGPKFIFLPATWNIGKTLVTSSISFKNHNDKSKPFECNVCGQSFSRQNALDKHIASKHAEVLLLVACPECDLKFKDSKGLDTHVRQFHVVTDHPCPNCKKYFSSKSSLNRHLDKCLKIRNYKCKECGEAFYQKHVLDDHMKHKHS